MGFVGRNKAIKIKGIKKGNFRYALQIDSGMIKKTIIVIMKNPSTTFNNVNQQQITKYCDRKNCHIDRTTGNVYRFLKNSYKRIIVLNLFSAYSTQASALNKIYNLNYNFATENSEIQKILRAFPNAPIVCAWGQPSGINKALYNQRISDVLNVLSGKKLLEYKKGLLIPFIFNSIPYPLHGLKWK